MQAGEWPLQAYGRIIHVKEVVVETEFEAFRM